LCSLEFLALSYTIRHGYKPAELIVPAGLLKEINPTTGLVAFGVSGRLRLQNF